MKTSDPIAQLHDRETEFHNEWARSVPLEKIAVREAFESPAAFENRFILRKMGDIRGLRLLDVGAGLGESSVYFALQGAKVTATDLSPGMVETAVNLAKFHGVSIAGVVSPGEVLNVPDGHFDLVYIANTIHHIGDRHGLFKQLRRVLKPGGRFFSIDPLAYNPVINLYRRMATKVRTPDEMPLTTADIALAGEYFDDVGHREFWVASLALFMKNYLIDRVHPNADRYWKRILTETRKELVVVASAQRGGQRADPASADPMAGMEHRPVGPEGNRLSGTMDATLTQEYEAYEERHWWSVARRDILHAMLDKSVPGASSGKGRWLDVGCGAGVVLGTYGGFAQRIGAELDPGTVERARAKGRDVRRTGENWNFSELGQFDCVSLFDVLEHVEHEQQALDSVRIVLKAGGTLLITVPAATLSLWSDHDVVAHHYRRYRAKDLLARFSANQWEILKVSYFSTRLFPIIWSVRQAKRLVGRLKPSTASRALNMTSSSGIPGSIGRWKTSFVLRSRC